MKISPITKRNITRIIPFGIIWLVLGCLFLWVEHAAIGNQSNTLDTAIKLDPQVLFFALIGVTIIGLAVGFVELLFLKRLFQKKSLSAKIISKFLIYIFFFVLIILITYPIAASMELDTSIFDSRVWDKFNTFFFSITALSTIIQLGFSLFVSLLYSEISENLGHNVLLNFFTGKYHKPVSETRIFMFADMKASTTIAEKLGHIKYFELLSSYYYDLSRAIVKNYGEVYQYIGDEIVISWKYKNGIKNNNSINCYFDMKLDLNKKRDSYMSKYGFFPDFKAALHFGEVTTGEIGALKKEIFFTGDVLNTTARIQGLCGYLGSDFLISKQLIDSLNLDDKYVTTLHGKSKLKGKSEDIELISLEVKK
tara:strand:+ start:10391 stop:11488 length:1098 start_codon:yes stop_codon:yes gene_type:complete